MLLVSAIMLSTASFAWFSMNTTVRTTGIEVEAYSDALYLTISNERDGDYAFSVGFDDTNKATRLVSLKNLAGESVYTITATKVADGTRYDSANASIAGNNYYRLLDADETNDTFDRDGGYRLVEFSELDSATKLEGYYSEANVTISVVTSAEKYISGNYYKKVGNAYELQSLSAGDELYGLYTITLGTSEGADSYYTGSGIYYRTDGNATDFSALYPVGGLELGTLIEDYYTIEYEAVSVFESGVDYYILSGNDYVYVGKIVMDNSIGGVTADDTDAIEPENYYFWSRAYSTNVSDAQTGASVSVIRPDAYTDASNPYFLYDTVYLRMEADANSGENLRVASVNVAGTDSISYALRIFFVATNGRGQVARATYNNRTGEIEHLDSTDESGEGILFDSILGDTEEIVEVKMYIYFDGTDESTKTEDYYILGQSVDIEFSIDTPDYLQH